MRKLNKKYWPIQFTLPIESCDGKRDSRERWCYNTLPSRVWHSFYSGSSITFAFKSEDDAIMFKLSNGNV